MRKTSVREKDLVVGNTYWAWEFDIQQNISDVYPMIYDFKNNSGYFLFKMSDGCRQVISVNEMKYIYNNQEAAGKALLNHMAKMVNKIHQLMSEVAAKLHSISNPTN